MAIAHSALTGSELHEPKGADGASAGEVMTADGAGGTSFSAPVVDPADGSAGEVPVADGAGDVVWSPRFYTITGKIDNISNASTQYIPIPYSGNVVKVTGVLAGAIGTADATITVKDNAGNTMTAITVANAASAAGDIDTGVPASNQDVTDDDYITVETDGASSTSVEWTFTIVIERDD